VRALLIEMAWSWLRYYQPDSALTRWFHERTQGTHQSRRVRRIAIVAVARRLAIALWRYLKDEFKQQYCSTEATEAVLQD
jgi:transposase